VVDHLVLLDQTQALTCELLDVPVVGLQPSDLLVQLLVALLQVEGHVFQLLLLAAHAQEMDEAVIAIDRRNDEEDQCQDTRSERAFVFPGR